MIKEAYCSYEVAKLLKEKGFDIPCYGRYSVRSQEFHLDTTKPCNNGGISQYSAPTHQMAMAWLREVYNIHIAIVPCEVSPGVMDYTYILYKVDVKNFIFKNLGILGRANTDKMSVSKTCEAALKYVLENLI